MSHLMVTELTESQEKTKVSERYTTILSSRYCLLEMLLFFFMMRMSSCRRFRRWCLVVFRCDILFCFPCMVVACFMSGVLLLFVTPLETWREENVCNVLEIFDKGRLESGRMRFKRREMKCYPFSRRNIIFDIILVICASNPADCSSSTSKLTLTSILHVQPRASSWVEESREKSRWWSSWCEWCKWRRRIRCDELRCHQMRWGHDVR